MAIQISDALKKRMLSPDPDVFRQDGKTYIVFDSIRIDMKTQQAEFLFAGKSLAFTSISGVDAHSTVTIDGIEGVLPLAISA